MTALGRVITFYSYKGGTGRTMAMANVAWILASNGHRVLVIDWDLEAPGLHRFLGPALPDPDQRTSDGLIDFLMEYVRAATRGKDDPAGEQWYESYTNIIRFAQPVSTGFATGRLDMIGPGRQNAEYAERVNMFDWRSFYERFKGRAVLDAVFAKLRSRYDFILIDSRTGVSDTSGICTVHLPDALVVMFTMNVQSIDGASGVALDARRQRDSKLEVYPVPTRIVLEEIERLQAARAAARHRFEPIVKGLDTADSDYLVGMEVPHVGYYLYEEQLAAVVEAGRPPVLLGIYEKLAAYVSRASVTKLKLLSDKELDAARARFRSGGAPGSAVTATRATHPKRHDVFLFYAEPDAAMARRVHDELGNLMSVFTPASDIKAGQTRQDAIREAIRASTAVVVLLTEAGASRSTVWMESEIAIARELDIPVIPVLIGSAKVPDSLHDVLAIKASVNEPGHIAEQIRSAMLASDRDGRSANERIAFLFAERNKLQADGHRIRRYLRYSIALAVSIGIIAISIFQIIISGEEAVMRRQERAEAKATSAERELRVMEADFSKLDRENTAARMALADTGRELGLLRSKLTESESAQEALRKTIQQLKRATDALIPSESGPLVLIFAPPDDTEQDAVQNVATALERERFLLGKQRVYAGRPPNGVTEVRYFRNPEDRDEAIRILAILRSSARLSEGRISFVVDPEIKRARYFEVRLNRSAFSSAAGPLMMK